MSTKYLEKFSKLIDKRQADQVLKLLNKKKQAGEIKTIDEFVQRLDTLIRELTQTELTPTLKLFVAKQDEIIDNETFNFMLERIEDDLVAGFEEANNIDEVQRSHQAIIKDVVFKKLRHAIAELETKVRLYEFMDSSGDGFDASIFSTFREVKENRTTRSVAQDSDVFIDPRTGLFFNEKEDAKVDLIGERLTLALTGGSKTYYNIKKVDQIFDENAPQSELVVNPPDIKLENIIDNVFGTYWVQSALFNSIKAYMRTKLEFRLPGFVDVNFIEVEAVSPHGVILESIDYEAGDGTITNLLQPEKLLLSPVSIKFEKVGTRRIILTFRNDNPDPLEFEYISGEDNLFSQSHSQPADGFSPELIGAMEDLDEILRSAKVKDVVGIFDRSITEFKGYEFTIGLDNVRIGLCSFRNKSIYVSPPLELDRIGQFGLKTIESRPMASSITGAASDTLTTYDTSDGNFFFSSIEYWAIKRDFDQLDNIVRTVRVPILPLDVSRVHHERLLLTEKSLASKPRNDIGATMFFTDATLGSVKIYRNGYLLTSDVDWLDVTTSTNKTPGNGDLMVFKVRIEDPFPGDIYTVTYTPMTSTVRGIPNSLSVYSGSGAEIVDLVGNTSIRSLPSQLIAVDRSVNESNIVRSKVFLCIIIRNNSSRKSLSAAVEEFLFLVNKKDNTKFED